MVGNILELHHVSKRYGHSDFALKDISFSLPYGSIMGYVGENGAGKTTTIGCILGTLHRDGGSIKLFGQEMRDQDTDIRAQIGVVYDGGNFPTYLNARCLASVMGGLYRTWDDALYADLLRKFGLEDKRTIKTYSRGMTMKLAIAVALAHHPKLLILDEATSGLDPAMREDMLDVFLDFVQDESHAILLSSHITSDLEKIADSITFIHDGEIILAEKKDDLIYHYAVMRLNAGQFAALDKRDIVAYRSRGHQIDVLAKNRDDIERKYRGMVVDNASVDEIVLLLVRGQRT